MRNHRKKMDYVKEGTFEVSFTEERTSKLNLKTIRTLPGREMREDIPRRKKSVHKGLYLEEVKL